MPAACHVYRLMWSGLDRYFLPVCAGCGKHGSRLFYDCIVTIDGITEPVCDICGLPHTQAGICFACQSHPLRSDASRFWSVFEGSIRHGLHALMYQRDLGLGDWFAGALHSRTLSFLWKIDLVVPMLFGQKRFEERGYNQVEMISRLLFLAMNRKQAPSALSRTCETRIHIGLSADKCGEYVRDAYTAAPDCVADQGIFLRDEAAATDFGTFILC